jgi:predicted GH43/DUF377 family glycosyl hydrolase
MDILSLTNYSIIAGLLLVGIGSAIYYVRSNRATKKKVAPKSVAPPAPPVERHQANPVISPKPHREWETYGTLNPAAVEDSKGDVHLMYRAIGDNGLSNIGHARSEDGLDFSTRSAFPVYRPSTEETTLATLEKEEQKNGARPKEYNPTVYHSGGGWGGYEDPRVVKIGDRVYMTYTDFQGWHSVRIALTSIAVSDLEKERWNWKKPQLISPANEVNKNWLIFPEKINGKYAILHGIVPKIMIDFVDDLDAPIKPISSPRKQGPQPGREDFWDSFMRGAGPPPLKTEIGWLLLYHAIDKNEPNKYKLGAMILDLKDPTNILYRSPHSILAPDACYENDGKPGVVYASGALIRDEQLVIYYGGGDKHVCVAQTELQPLLGWLMEHGRVSEKTRK